VIHCVRGTEPNFPPDPGRSRSLIGGLYVEWSIVEPTPQEVLDYPPIAITANLRADAKAVLSDTGRTYPKGVVPEHKRGLAKLLRAVADAARDSDNSMRAWITSFKAAVAAATNLADLKTRVAALPALPAITNAQLVTAISSRIDDGTVD
jgi:hypothetical protein